MLTIACQDSRIPTAAVRSLLILIVASACGDNQLPREVTFVGASGDRLKLQWYLYQDGTRQPEPAGFYDAQLHTRCAPEEWTDGVRRCTPIGHPTVFADAECTMELGRRITMRDPTHFIGFDRIDGELRAARVYETAKRFATVPAAFYERRDGICTRIAEPPTLSYVELGNEITMDRMADVWSDSVIDERLHLSVLASADGLVAPIGFRDQALDLDCRAEQLPDGTIACAPTDAIAARHFADPLCEQPVVVAPSSPRAVTLADTNGCSTYRATAEEHTSIIFRREGTTCVQASREGNHAYRVGAPLELAPIARTVGDDPDRRLQPITLATGNLVVFDTRLHDTATRSDCKSYGNGDLAVCVPTTTVAGRRLYANAQCGREVLIADLPPVACAPSTFAVVDEMSIHAIGTPHTGTLYQLDAGGQCRVRPTPTGLVPHVLGPSIPLDTFVGGVVFSER